MRQRIRVAVHAGVGVAAAAVLVGGGVLVGARQAAAAHDEQAAALAAGNVVAPATASMLPGRDDMLLRSFLVSAKRFENLLESATPKNRERVGPHISTEAVRVLTVKRHAQTPQLRDAAAALGDAMLLIGAGITADDAGAVTDGAAKYEIVQSQMESLTATVEALPAP